MKRKMLLVGKNEPLKDFFYDNMSSVMLCQTTSDRVDDFLNHVEYFRPDALIYCMGDENGNSMKSLIDCLEKMERRLPLFLIGDAKNCVIMKQLAGNRVALSFGLPVAGFELQKKVMEYFQAKERELETKSYQEILPEREIVALPKREKKGVKLTDLLDVEILQSVQDSFCKMTGIAAGVCDENGVAITRDSLSSDFCMNYNKKSKIGRQRCEMCDKRGGELALEEGKSVAYRCHTGMVDFAAPIMGDGRVLGSFVGGQVRVGEVNEERLRRIAADIGVDAEDYIAAAKKTKRVDAKTITNCAEFVYKISNLLSEMAASRYRILESGKEVRVSLDEIRKLTEQVLTEHLPGEVEQKVRKINFMGRKLIALLDEDMDLKPEQEASVEKEKTEKTGKPEESEKTPEESDGIEEKQHGANAKEEAVPGDRQERQEKLYLEKEALYQKLDTLEKKLEASDAEAVFKLLNELYGYQYSEVEKIFLRDIADSIEEMNLEQCKKTLANWKLEVQ